MIQLNNKVGIMICTCVLNTNMNNLCGNLFNCNLDPIKKVKRSYSQGSHLDSSFQDLEDKEFNKYEENDDIVNLNGLQVNISKLKGHLKLSFCKNDQKSGTYNELIKGVKIGIKNKNSKNYVGFTKVSNHQKKQYNGSVELSELVGQVNCKFGFSLYLDSSASNSVYCELSGVNMEPVYSREYTFLAKNNKSIANKTTLNSNNELVDTCFTTDNGLIFTLLIVGNHLKILYRKSNTNDKETYGEKLKNAIVKITDQSKNIVRFSRGGTHRSKIVEEYNIIHTDSKTFSLYPQINQDTESLNVIFTIGDEEYSKEFTLA